MAVDKHSIERGAELCVSILDQEAQATTVLFEVGSEGAGPWGDPGVVGVGGDAEPVDDPTFDLDHEEDIGAPQRHGVDGEEIGCQYTLGLGTEERPPGRSPAGGRPETSFGQDLGDRARGQRSARLEQLALDAPVTPPRILPPQTDHHLPRLGVHLRSPRASVRGTSSVCPRGYGARPGASQGSPRRPATRCGGGDDSGRRRAPGRLVGRPRVSPGAAGRPPRGGARAARATGGAPDRRSPTVGLPLESSSSGAKVVGENKLREVATRDRDRVRLFNHSISLAAGASLSLVGWPLRSVP